MTWFAVSRIDPSPTIEPVPRNGPVRPDIEPKIGTTTSLGLSVWWTAQLDATFTAITQLVAGGVDDPGLMAWHWLATGDETEVFRRTRFRRLGSPKTHEWISADSDDDRTSAQSALGPRTKRVLTDDFRLYCGMECSENDEDAQATE